MPKTHNQPNTQYGNQKPSTEIRAKQGCPYWGTSIQHSIGTSCDSAIKEEKENEGIKLEKEGAIKMVEEQDTDITSSKNT